MTDNRPIKLLSICGSLRRQSYNRALMQALPPLLPDEVAMVEAPSFAAFPLYNADLQAEQGVPAPVQALAEAVAAADGVVVVTPEYNFSVPGGLKNAFDWLSRLDPQPFRNKPVAIMSAATGPVGGARVQYDLRKVFLFLDAVVLTKPEIFVAHCAQRLDPTQGIIDATTEGFVQQQLHAFVDQVRRS